MTDHAGLIERLEACVPPDRELDHLLEEYFYADTLKNYRRRERAEGWVSDNPSVIGADLIAPAQPYTASLDAAIALVERVRPGWDRNVGKAIYRSNGIERVVHTAAINGQGGNDFVFAEEGPNEPIALLIALLRSLGTNHE